MARRLNALGRNLPAVLNVLVTGADVDDAAVHPVARPLASEADAPGGNYELPRILKKYGGY